MSGRPAANGRAHLWVTLTATGWVAGIAIWFIVMGAIAIFAGDSPVVLAALMAVFVGGVYLLTVLSNARHRSK